MEILGIGMPEIIFILVVALIVMGPKDMQKTSKVIGKWLRDIVMSPNWMALKNASKEIQNIPTRLIREANMELDQINKIEMDVNDPLGNLNREYPAPQNSLPTASVQDRSSTPVAGIKEDESDQEEDA